MRSRPGGARPFVPRRARIYRTNLFSTPKPNRQNNLSLGKTIPFLRPPFALGAPLRSVRQGAELLNSAVSAGNICSYLRYNIRRGSDLFSNEAKCKKNKSLSWRELCEASYIVTYDTGFRRTRFGDIARWPAASPRSSMRQRLALGWVGLPPNSQGNKIVYYMRVDEVMGVDSYWNDRRFRQKRPRRDSTLRLRCGDNTPTTERGVSLPCRPYPARPISSLTTRRRVSSLASFARIIYWRRASFIRSR
jgi:hypothetical protein